MQFDMFGDAQGPGDSEPSTPVMGVSGVWKSPECLALDAALRAGSLSDAVAMMKNLNTKALEWVLLESGFTLAYSKNRKELLDFVSPQLLDASRRGVSGHELRQIRAAESAKSAEERGDDSFNPANYAASFMPPVSLGDFLTHEDGFNYVVNSTTEQGGKIVAIRPLASDEKTNSVKVIRLTEDAAKLAKERYIVDRARAVKDESPVLGLAADFTELIRSRMDPYDDMHVRINDLVYRVVYTGDAPSSEVDVERLLFKEGSVSHVEALTLPRDVALVAARDFFPDVASFDLNLAKSQVAVVPSVIAEFNAGVGPVDSQSASPLQAVPITPEMAANFTPGVRVIDGAGKVYEAFSSRHGYLQVFPIGATGKAEVFAGNSIFFHLDPGSAAAFPSRRHDPIYVAFSELAVESGLGAPISENIERTIENSSNSVHTAFIDDAETQAENKEHENGERGNVRRGTFPEYSTARSGGVGDRGSLDVGLAGEGSGVGSGGNLPGMPDQPGGQGSGRTDRRAGEREASGGARALETGGDSAVSARTSSLTDVVIVPQLISEAIAADMGKQKARLLRLRTIASVPGATLEQRLSLQAKEKSADDALRLMRLAVFDVEDETLRAIESRDASLFGVRALMFPLTAKALAGHVASLQPVSIAQSTPEAEADPFIGREFNTIWGRAKIVSLVSRAKPDYGMQALYEYKTDDNRYLRVAADKIETTIAKHEFDASPEGVAATEAGRIAFEAKQSAFEAAQVAAVEAKAALDARLTPFIANAGYPSLKAGLARKTLLSQLRYEGQILHRFEFVEKLIGAGYQPVIGEEDRIQPMSRRAFNRATGFEQDQHAKRVLAAGKKTVYRLETEDSSFDIGAFEYAFAQHARQSQSLGVPEIAALHVESQQEIEPTASKNITMATDADLASLVSPKESPKIGEGARVRYTDLNLDDALSPGIIEGVVVNADSTSTGNVRYRIRTDALGQGGHPIERMVYSHQGRLDVLPMIEVELSTTAKTFVASNLNADSVALRLAAQVGMFDPELKAEREAIQAREASRNQAHRDRLALIRSKMDQDTSAWDQTVFAPRIHAILESLAQAGEAGIELRSIIQAGINMDVKSGKLTEETVAFREKVAQRELATFAENGNFKGVSPVLVTSLGLIEIEPDIGMLPVPIVDIAVLKLNEMGKSLGDMGFVEYHDVGPRAPEAARDVAAQMRETMNALLLLAPIRERVAKGHKNAKQEKLDRLEDFASEVLGINTRMYPGVVATNIQTAMPVTSVADFVITDEDRIGLGGSAEKFRDNLRAIQIVRLLDAEQRTATPGEMGGLARYVGWGGLKGVFDPNNRQWARQHATLKSLLSDVEWAAASRSQLDAHFTSPIVVKAMYSAVSRLGFEGGRVLESSVGVGNFFGMMPTNIRQGSDLHGVELDVLTSQIVSALYPSATIAKGIGFQSYDVPSGYFDMTIGNPPFGSSPIIDEKGSVYSGWSVHNYFFAKNIDMLRPGGIMPMVVSHNFLDKLDPHVRQWISRRAELISGVRLPNTAFKENANTEVVTDILVFRRLDFENTLGSQEKPDWLDTTDVKIENPKTGELETVAINNYFLNNPQNVLGTQSAAGNLYRANEYTVEPNGDLAEQLAAWVETLPQGIYQPLDRSLSSVINEVQEAANIIIPDTVKEGSFFIFEDVVYQRGPDRFGGKKAIAWASPNQKANERMKGMIQIRDALREQLKIERSEALGSDIEAGRTVLNRAYDDFKKQFGFVNDQVNKRLFHDDTESALVQSLEFNYEKAITPAKALEMGMEPRPAKSDKADIFSRRVLFPPGEVEVVETAKDALLHSLNYTGGVDMAYMQRAYGKDESAIVAELGDLLFVDPDVGLVTADSYLSGDVKTKLVSVQKLAASDPAFSRNLEALKAVIPVDKLPSEIHAAIGAAWIPSKVFSDFALEISGANISYTHLTATGNWLASAKGEVNFAKNNNEFGTEKMGAMEILLLTMNSRAPEIKKTIERDGKDVLVTDEEKTEAVRQKADQIKTHWDSWLWSDGPRADELTAIFNERFNRTVERKYDGSHLTFPGMSSSMSLLAHQKNGVWRGLQDRVMLMDQVVGAGKTYECVAMMMEMRRLGITKKPMIAVPNHLTLQWRSEFYKLYPGANVLAATPQDFDKDNRERFFSKITTGNWDAVIVGHSSLKKLQVPIEAEQSIIKEQFDDLSKAIQELKAERGDRNIIRDMEKIKANLEAKIAKLKEKGGSKDNVVDFGDLGVDSLFIDEMHEFKNLFFTTQMNRVAGLGNPSGSGKAFDLFVKIRWLQETFGQNAPLIAATGTPISNSLAEMFTMQRYMQYAKLKSNGLHVFDTWAKQYGDVQNVYEVAPSGSGYRLSQRFAKFKNLGSLMGEYRSFSDVITLDDLKAQEAALGKAFPVPKLEGGKPRNIIADRSELQIKFFGIPEMVRDDDGVIQFELNADLPTSVEKNAEGRYIVKQVDMTDAGKSFERVMSRSFETEPEAAYQAALSAVTPKMTIDPESIVGQFENLAALTRATKGKINALSLTGLANKAGLDYRLIDAHAPDFPGSKVNQAVTNILATAKAWEADKGTQLVFCDLSVPLSAKSKMASKEKRLYVRDADGDLTHKKGTLHSIKGQDGLSYFMVQEGKGTTKSFTMYDPMTGVIMKEGLDSKSAGAELVATVFSRDGGAYEWMVEREKMPLISQEEIDDYKNEHTLDTEGDSADVELSLVDIEGASGVAGFSIYDDMKAKLVAQGIPEHQIQFIHDHDTPQAKDMLFKRVNSGEVRVLFGSTPKMGAGTNVQERLVALHHIDAPWRPSDLEQREGRIIRRGNALYARDPDGFRIEVNRYATSQTYDTRRWQLLEHKAAGLAQLRNYSGASEIEDVANEAANSADMKAAASGNPLILKETQLSNDVKRLRLLERAHRDGEYMKRSMMNSHLSFANGFGPNLITGMEALKTQRDTAPALGIYGSQQLNEKEAVMDALDTIKSRISSLGASQTLIYRGLKFEFAKDSQSIFDKMKYPDGDIKLLDVFSRSGVATRMENWCNKIDWDIDLTKKKIDSAFKKAGEIQSILGQPFAENETLSTAIAEHGKVQRALMKANSLAAVKPADAVEFAAAVVEQKKKMLALGFGEALAEMEMDGASDSFVEAGLSSVSPGSAPPALAASAQVPLEVKSKVQWALDQLRSVEMALDGVQRARGNGHILSLEVKDQAVKLVRPNEVLAEFRKHALNNGVDAEALIVELGGLPDLTRFSTPLAEMAGSATFRVGSVASVPEYFPRFESAMLKAGFGVDKTHGVYGLSLQHSGRTAVVAWCYPGADDSLPGSQGLQKIVVRGFVPGGTKQDTFYFDNEASFEKALNDSLVYVTQRFDEAFKSIDAQMGVGMESYVKVAADSIGELRKSDVFRVLVESNRTAYRPSIAAYIKDKRPDLAAEVDDVMEEALAEEVVKPQVSAALSLVTPIPSVVNVDGLKTRLVDVLDCPELSDVPADWIVMNAPRPLLGMKTAEGGFVTGRFYAAIDPSDTMATTYVRENEMLDARLLVVMSRDDQMEVALKDNFYREKYLEIEPEKRFDMLRSSFEKVRDMPYGLLMDTLKAAKGVVAEGMFSGAILDIAHGIATQKVNRDGGTTSHDLSKLNFANLKVGDVVDIKYEGGAGIVANPPAKGVGVGR